MNPIVTKVSAPNGPGFFGRIARRFCEARMQYVRREIENQRHFLDAIGGPIGFVSACADPSPTIVFSGEPKLGTTNASELRLRPHRVADPPSTVAKACEILDRSDDEGGYNHRMSQNLAAAAWVGILMTSAYYVFSTLLAVS